MFWRSMNGVEIWIYFSRLDSIALVHMSRAKIDRAKKEILTDKISRFLAKICLVQTNEKTTLTQEDLYNFSL